MIPIPEEIDKNFLRKYEIRLLNDLDDTREFEKKWPIESHQKNIFLGREPSNKISFQDRKTVSGKHAAIKFVDEIPYIVDLNSTNGTFIFIKSIDIKPKEEITLSFGTTEIVFKILEKVLNKL